MKYIKNRAQEKSTIAGVAFILGLFGIKILPEQMDMIPMAITGGIALFEMSAFTSQGLCRQRRVFNYIGLYVCLPLIVWG